MRRRYEQSGTSAYGGCMRLVLGVFSAVVLGQSPSAPCTSSGIPMPLQDARAPNPSFDSFPAGIIINYIIYVFDFVLQIAKGLLPQNGHFAMFAEVLGPVPDLHYNDVPRRRIKYFFG